MVCCPQHQRCDRIRWTGSKPVPLSEAEMKPLGIKSDNVSIDFTEGDTIVVVAGAWKDTVGAVYKIDYNKQTVTINVELFGRDTCRDQLLGGSEIRLSVLERGHRDVQWSDPLSSGSSVCRWSRRKTLRHTTIYLGGPDMAKKLPVTLSYRSLLQGNTAPP